MRGYGKNSCVMLMALGLLACEGEEAGLDAGPAPDAGPSAPADGGVTDAGPEDTGPAVRTLTEVGWMPDEEVHNYFLVPDFDLSLFNLGWQTGGAEGGQSSLTRRIDVRVPGARDEWLEIEGRNAAPPRTFLAGFAHATPGRYEVSVWVGQPEVVTGPFTDVEVGVHGVDIEGGVRALLLEPDPSTEVVAVGRRWRRYRAETERAWVGFVTFLALNGSEYPVGFATPHLRPAPEQRRLGAARRPGVERAPRPAERALLARIWAQSQVAPEPALDPWGLPDTRIEPRRVLESR